MHSAKKQINALGLLLLMALPLFLSVGIFVKQQIIQNERTERFESELIQTISVPLEKVHWVEHGKEVLINGKLFDVESFETSGNNLILTGFYDQTEDLLVEQSSNLVQQKENANSPFNHLVVKFMFFPIYNENLSFTVHNNWQIIESLFGLYTRTPISQSFPEPAPPPKNC